MTIYHDLDVLWTHSTVSILHRLSTTNSVLLRTQFRICNDLQVQSKPHIRTARESPFYVETPIHDKLELAIGRCISRSSRIWSFVNRLETQSETGTSPEAPLEAEKPCPHDPKPLDRRPIIGGALPSKLPRTKNAKHESDANLDTRVCFVPRLLREETKSSSFSTLCRPRTTHGEQSGKPLLDAWTRPNLTFVVFHLLARADLAS